MQILSYNPEEDSFFVGLTLEEFEYVVKEHNVDYGYNSSYENEKEYAMNRFNDVKVKELPR